MSEDLVVDIALDDGYCLPGISTPDLDHWLKLVRDEVTAGRILVYDSDEADLVAASFNRAIKSILDLRRENEGLRASLEHLRDLIKTLDEGMATVERSHGL